MKELLNRLINHERLDKEEARSVLIAISEGKYNPSQIAAFLTVRFDQAIARDPKTRIYTQYAYRCSHRCPLQPPQDLVRNFGVGKYVLHVV